MQVPAGTSQLNGWFVSTLSMFCQAVFARLGSLLAQRGFGRQAFDRVCVADVPFAARPHDPPACGAEGTRTPYRSWGNGP
jgi:hypothetical protein